MGDEITVLDFINDVNENAMKVDGYDDCVIGIVSRFGEDPILAYDTDRVLNKLMLMGMTSEEAYEYFAFNILGAYVGPGTPAFVDIWPGAELWIDVYEELPVVPEDQSWLDLIVCCEDGSVLAARYTDRGGFPHFTYEEFSLDDVRYFRYLPSRGPVVPKEDHDE